MAHKQYIPLINASEISFEFGEMANMNHESNEEYESRFLPKDWLINWF